MSLLNTHTHAPFRNLVQSLFLSFSLSLIRLLFTFCVFPEDTEPILSDISPHMLVCLGDW